MAKPIATPPKTRTDFMKRATIFPVLFSLALANAETFTLDTRDRVRDADGDWAVRQQKVLWDAKATAVIVCDMWD
ncbi:hypothetical protein OAM02_00730, partial [Verrucomicrobia bacterium]|nr:hypothetical protein [Verrucomicrobiota bacterium]